VTSPAHLNLVDHVLDHAIVDANDIPCGVVDDLELSGKVGEPLHVTALLVGPGAWAPRLPRLFAWMAARVFGTQRVRVPWTEVDTIAERVKLKSTAGALGLGKLDRKAGRWLARLPGSEKAH
jgi:hypothetical protein